MKRLLSMLLVVTILVSVIPANAFAQNAQPTTSTESQVDQATVNNENLTVTGTNHIGDMLSKNIQQEQASNVEALQTGYDVISLTVENNKATVEFFAKDEASLVVAIYDNDRTQLLSSSTVDVTADEEKVTLELPDTLPEYFHASAYLVSPEDQRPLCTALHTEMYTREIQELLQSTIDDYNPDLVLNLDEQTDTNFAVYNEDAVVVQEQGSVNTVVSVDDDNLTYVIENPSQEIRTLMYGDVLSLPYGDEDILFVKVDRVSVSGNTATITGLPIEMQDVFSHVKIDSDANLENAQVDTETADEGVSFEGIVEDPATRAFEGGSSVSHTLTYKFFKNIKEGSEGEYGEASLQVNGLFSLKVSIGVKYYIAWYKQEFEFSVDAEGSFEIGCEGTAKLTIPLGKVNIPAFAGINVGFEPKLILELKGKMETVISITSKFGISFVPGEGIKNISEPLKASASLKAEATIFAGFDLSPNVNIIDPSVAKVSLSVPIGAELTAKMTGSAFEGMESVTKNHHGCAICIDIGLDVKFGISAEVTFLNKKWLTWGFNIIELKRHLLDGYYSVDYNEFGWTKCPHKVYPLTVTVLNSDGQPMKDVSVRYVPEANPIFPITDAEGKTRTFLPNGEYTLTATKGDYAGSSTVKVNNGANATIKVLLTGDVTENVKWSLTESGGLTIFGNGAIPSYANSSQLPWSAYISKVKSISISDDITGIGANAFRDHTNVTSVYIGKSVSSIDFSAFEGLNYSVLLVSGGNPYYVLDAKGVLYNKNKTTLYKALFSLESTYDVPDTVTNIASKAFAGQTMIPLIHFKGNAPTIASDAFSGVNTEALYCIRTSGWTQDKLQQYGGTITWSSYDGLLGSGTFDRFTWQLDTDGLLRISGIGEMTNYTSASQTPWYKYRENIKTVVLSNGITAIGDYAFAECTALETITIPATANRIGKYAFYNCSSLAEISIPQAVSAISTYTFYNCSSLTEISLPEGVAAIESYAFYGCSNLQSINIPERVTVIEKYTFYNCSSLQEVPLHDEITVIGEYAFYNCTGFRELVIPNTVTEIGQYAFAKCSGVLNLRIRENVDSDFPGLTIGAYAFQNCTSLRAAKIPDSTVRINEGIFSGCRSLESISIPFVGDQIRSNTESTKPFGYIFGTSQFSDAQEVFQGSAFYKYKYYVPLSLKTVIVTGGEIVNYAFEDCRMLQTVVIPETVTVIGNFAFYGCSKLTSITIPDSVQSIGHYAFSSCTSLASITIPEGVTSIGEHAFSHCYKLTSITIPDSVQSIGEYAFFYSGLKKVTFGENSELTSIGDSAFEDCSGLTGITIPDSVTSIGDYVFSDCSSLACEIYNNAKYIGNSKNPYMVLVSSVSTNITSCTIHSDTKFIHTAAFSSCAKLTSITIPDGVQSIGKSAFSGCSSLKSMTLPFVGGSRKTASDTYQYPFGYIFGTSSYTGGVSTEQYYYGSSTSSTTHSSYYIPSSLKSVTITGGDILFGAFYNCSNLTSVTILDSVTSIGNDAFYNCSSLTSVTFGDDSQLTSIGNYAFYGCSNLGSVAFGDDSQLTSIGHYAFSLCTSLTSITIPNSVTSIGDSAFSNCSSLACEIYNNAKYIGNSKNPYMVLVSSVSTDITSCTIHSDTKFIYTAAFSSCAKLTSITIPDSVQSIGKSAFDCCSSLTDVTFGENSQLTSIDNYAFENCSKLTSITIPDSVTSIGEYAFDDCYKLTSITFQGDAPTIGSYAFANVSAIAYYPSGNATWISSVMQNYGGTITWKAYTPTKCDSQSGTTEPTVKVSTAPETTALESTAPETTALKSTAPETTALKSTAPKSTVPEFTVSAQKSSPQTDRTTMRTVTFEDLDPGEEYIFLSLVSENEENPLIYENLLFIDQLCADENGVITVTYRPRFASDSICELVRGGAVKNLAEATVTWPDCTDNGTQQFFAPTVSYNGEILTENVDYVLEGDISFCVLGTYHCYVVGIGDYIGSYPCSYVVTEYTNSSKGLSYSISTDGDSYVVTGIGTCTDTEIIIPAMYNDLPVTGINRSAFKNCTNLTSVTIPDSVDIIVSYAFEYCTSLTSIFVGENSQLSSVGVDSFYNCTRLTYNTYDSAKYFGNSKNPYIVLVESVSTDITSCTIYENTKNICSGAFKNCSSLTSIDIPDSVTSIGNSAFRYCSRLTDITIPSGVTSIGNSAFSDCSSLTNITFGENSQMTNIGGHAFKNCSSLTSIDIPDSVTVIGSYAFSGCSSLESITIPFVGGSKKTASNTNQHPFGYIFGTASYTGSVPIWQASSTYYIPTSLKFVTVTGGDIFHGAFSRCSSLTDITIPDSVQSIGNSAFYGCDSLIRITIPESVTSIGNSAFSGCSSLTDITIPDSVQSIGNDAFSYCSKLTSITIPDSVTSIGNDAFYNCSSLTSVTFGDDSQLTSIGNYAFYSCIKLTSITIPDSVTSIGNYAFRNCNGLTSIAIPDSVTSIGSYAFYYCSSLTDITIPDSITSIGNYAFYYCSSLTDITIPDSVTSIGDHAFYRCTGLTDITFGENSQLTSIGNSAFYDCYKLTSITIPNSVTSIGDYAFDGCDKLTSITIPNSVTSIGNYAFRYCSKLTSITIPDSVTSIGDSAFYSCIGLRKIEFLGNAPSSGSNVFSGDTLTVYYPGNDATWTSDVMKTYSATSIRWVAAKTMVYSADGTVSMYETLADAIAACQLDQRIVLLADVTETISVDKDLHIDLNGNTLEGLTVEGTLYCIDSTASAITAGTGVAKVTGIVAQDHTVDGVRYIALGNDGSYTFHALQLKLSFVTFRVNAAGIYYKAEVVCDPVLQAAIDSYGVALSLHSMPGTDFATDSNADYTQISGVPAIGEIFSSGSVFGIFKDGQDNAQRGQEKIYANAYIKLKDGTCLMSDQTTGDQVTDQDFDGVAWSLRDVLTQLNSTFNQLEVKQQTLLKEFCTTWKDVVSGWNLRNILKEN